MLRNAIIALFLGLASSTLGQLIHEVTPINLGDQAEDYAPVLLDSGFVMCSIRETDATIAFKNADTGKPLADLYWVPLKNDMPGTPVLLSANLATPVNEGPATFTENGRTICFTRNVVLPKKLSNLKASNSQLGLFFSTLENDVWSLPQPFEHNSTKFSMMHPAFSSDGNILIFASDMPGGEGGVDLYRSERTASGWSQPTNLGPSINSPSNEAFPTFGPNELLYFSSDRSGGMGKLDIYVSESTKGDWTSPTALPTPINSTGNDLGLTARGDGYSGYFSTNRTGVDRIFFWKKTVPKFRECTPQEPNNYCYSFKAKPHAATSSLPLDHVWELGDGERVVGGRVDHCYTEPGTYTVRSLLVDRKTGAVFYELKKQELIIADNRQAWVSAPDTVRTGRTLALDALRSHVPDMAIAEYHWDLGNGTTMMGDRIHYTYKVPGVYEVKLDVISRPNETGLITNQCNSRKVIVMDRFRDQEDLTVVATYQDAMGLTHSFEYQELPFDASGLEADGFADATFSVELFASKERVSLDDPKFTEVRKLYRVVEHFDPERGVYTYSVGETSDMDELYKIFKKVKELQFLDAEVHQLQEEKLIDLSRLDFTSIEELNHSKVSTNAIHFAYNSAELETGTNEVLEQLIGLLRQHPELKLIIEAHTDDVGSRSYNFDLSQQRAQTVRAYLEAHDISADRLLPIGHGKNQPIASNKTEEGRSQNRRVEFRMTVNDDQQAFEKTR
jgi:outer membrane protein OmpA-like peptidoglycan-associated protein